MITIASLRTYPVKSCRGLEHRSVRLTEAGPAHDREWMFVTPAGRFLTQREAPSLARIEVELDDRVLRLSVAGATGVCVPLDRLGTRVAATVWGERVGAFDEGDEAATWAGGLLGREVRLVRFDPASRRLSSRDWTGAIEAPNRFTDGFPLLLISRASLDDLNSRLPAPLPMARFRPNVVLDGLPPYGEDALRELSGDGVRLRIVKPCTRCVITATDQDTGAVAGEEPLRTLRTYRWDALLKGVVFGQNAIVVEGAGRTLEVGATLD